MSNQNQKINISWSTKELDEWVRNALINPALLSTDRLPELAQFIANNKDTLYATYRDPEDSNLHIIQMPSYEKWNETYELHVIEKTTGKTVKVLERMEPFELCDDLTLQIKSSEKDSWNSKTSAIKNLSKEERKTLKTALMELCKVNNGQLHINEIVELLEKFLKTTQRGTYTMSGHMVNQILQTKERLPITDEKEQEKYEVKAGIKRLSGGEHRIIKSLGLLLDKNKRNQNGAQIEGLKILDSCKLFKNALLQKAYGFSPTIMILDEHEYFEAYYGGSNYGGTDRKYMRSALEKFCKREFDVRYDRIYWESGEEFTDRILFKSSVAEAYPFFPSLTNEEKKKLNLGDEAIKKMKKKIILVINQIFTDQIESNFIKYPVDINQRMQKAARGSATPSMYLLMDYCLREIRHSRYNVPIGEDKLIEVLELDKAKKEGRKSRLDKSIKEAINTVKNLGLILEAHKTKGQNGKPKFELKLNDKPWS